MIEIDAVAFLPARRQQLEHAVGSFCDHAYDGASGGSPVDLVQSVQHGSVTIRSRHLSGYHHT